MTREPSTLTADPPALVDLIADGVEPPITLEQACRLPELSVDGRPMNRGKLYRLANRPTRGVIFPTAVIAGVLVTTRPAVRRWLVATNDRRPSSGGTTPRRQAAAAKRAHANAMAELSRAGLTGRRAAK